MSSESRTTRVLALQVLATVKKGRHQSHRLGKRKSVADVDGYVEGMDEKQPASTSALVSVFGVAVKFRSNV